MKNSRNQQLSPSDVRRYLRGMANKLSEDRPLSEEERIFLAHCLGCISEGDSADDVLGLVYGKGHSEQKDSDRIKWSLVLGWVGRVVLPESSGGEGYTLSQAFEEAEYAFQPFFPGIDADKIKRAWQNPAYVHMRAPVRRSDDPDWPF